MSKSEFWREPEDTNFDVYDPSKVYSFNNLNNSFSYTTPNNVGLVVRKAAGQTGNLAEFQDSTGNVLCYIDCNGVFHGELANDDALGKPTKDYYDQLFFLTYHMGISVQDAIKLGQQGRDIFITRFLEQEEKAKNQARNNSYSSHYYRIDDTCNLQQMASGEGNLDFIYSAQYVMNEKTNVVPGGTNESWFILEHTPIIKGTLTGTVYRDNKAIQTFVISEAGVSTLCKVGTPAIFVEKVKLDTITGEIGTFWNDKAPGPHHLVVNYEYNLEV